MTDRWENVVRSVLDEARRTAGGGTALAAALLEGGVGPDTGAYSDSAVSNWIKGRTRPPADVVLAAASLFGISLDPRLGVATESERAAISSEDDGVSRLRAEFAHLEQLVNRRLAPGAPRSEHTKDVVAVYGTRAEAASREPLLRTIAAAEHIDAMGLSLNGIAQQISDVTLVELVEGGLTLRALLLDPDSEATATREREEGMPQGHLAEITRTNLQALARTRDKLSAEARDRLQLRTYHETLRFNLLVADGRRALVQWYLPHARGIDSPTVVVEAQDDQPHGLFPVFSAVFGATWDAGNPW